MDIKENNAGLGKNHDAESRDQDLAKKQSEAQPVAENLDMMPNSVNQNGESEFTSNTTTDLHEKASAYAFNEHKKAKNWENKNQSQ